MLISHTSSIPAAMQLPVLNSEEDLNFGTFPAKMAAILFWGQKAPNFSRQNWVPTSSQRKEPGTWSSHFSLL